MAAKKYHIGRNGEPAVCHAKGKCPLGGSSGVENHFTNYQDALKRSEELYEARFIGESKSAAMSKRFAEKTAPKLLKGDIAKMRAGITAKEAVDVFNSVSGRKTVDLSEKSVLGHREYPVVRMRRSAGASKSLDAMRSAASAAARGQEALAVGHPAQAVAATQKSLDNVNADLARVKTLLANNSLKTKPDYTRADVFYATDMTKGAETGMIMYTSTRFDTERLEADLKKAGYSLEDAQAVSQTWSDAKIRDAMIAKIRAASPELAGRKGVNETLDAAMEASGLFTKSVDWSPNSKAVDAVAAEHPDAVVPRQLADDTAVTTTNSGELRQMFCELNRQKAALEARQTQYSHEIVASAGEDVFKNAKGRKVTIAGMEFSSRTSWTFEPARGEIDPSLPEEERKRLTAERDAQISTFIRDDLGGDPADFKTGRRTVTEESLKAFSAAHPDARIGYWKYARPQQNFRYRDIQAESNPTPKFSKKVFTDVRFRGEFE